MKVTWLSEMKLSRFEVLTAVLLRIQAVWGVML